MYWNVLFLISRTIIILRFPVSFVLKSTNVSIQLCNWLFTVWVLGRFWCGNDKYYVLYSIIICYLSKTRM